MIIIQIQLFFLNCLLNFHHYYRSHIRGSEREHLQNINFSSKMAENETLKHQHQNDIDNNTNLKISRTSPTYLENLTRVKKEEEYNGNVFDATNKRFPYARELVESYQQKLSTNLETRTTEEGDEEEVIVDTVSDSNARMLYQTRDVENSNVPEDLSKKGRKRDASVDDSTLYHHFRKEKSARTQSPEKAASSPDVDHRKSPSTCAN